MEHILYRRDGSVTSCSFVLLFIAVSVTSCFSNEMYLDVPTQEIRSCNPKGIRHMQIENDSTAEVAFTFEWTQEKNAPATIRLSSVDQGYFVTDERMYRVDNKAVKLKPLTRYTLERFGGDAGSYRMSVWTDKGGKVVKADPETCR